MEQQTIDAINAIIKTHETSLHWHNCGDEANKINGIIEHYQRRAAEGIAGRKEIVEDTVSFIKAIQLVVETIGNSGTHVEKAARVRGCVELLNTILTRLRKEQENDLFAFGRDMFTWNHSTYPYQSILQKYDELKRENEVLKQAAAKGQPDSNDLLM